MINYHVKCDSSKLELQLKKDRDYIIKKFIRAISKRREFVCYGKSRIKKTNS